MLVKYWSVKKKSIIHFELILEVSKKLEKCISKSRHKENANVRQARVCKSYCTSMAWMSESNRFLKKKVCLVNTGRTILR